LSTEYKPGLHAEALLGHTRIHNDLVANLLTLHSFIQVSFTNNLSGSFPLPAPDFGLKLLHKFLRDPWVAAEMQRLQRRRSTETTSDSPQHGFIHLSATQIKMQQLLIAFDKPTYEVAQLVFRHREFFRGWLLQ
jgi:hypothetical protein